MWDLLRHCSSQVRGRVRVVCTWVQNPDEHLPNRKWALSHTFLTRFLLLSDYTCNQLQVHVPKPLVGFVIGRNGEHINNIQNTCGVRLQFQNGECTYLQCTVYHHDMNCLSLEVLVWHTIAVSWLRSLTVKIAVNVYYVLLLTACTNDSESYIMFFMWYIPV